MAAGGRDACAMSGGVGVGGFVLKLVLEQRTAPRMTGALDLPRVALDLAGVAAAIEQDHEAAGEPGQRMGRQLFDIRCRQRELIDEIIQRRLVGNTTGLTIHLDAQFYSPPLFMVKVTPAK